MKETKLDRKEFNLLVNDILLDIKPVKLRIVIANRLIEFFDKKQEQIEEMEEQLLTLLNRVSDQNKEILDLSSQVIVEKLKR